MAEDRIDGVDSDEAPESRTQRLVEMFRRSSAEATDTADGADGAIATDDEDLRAEFAAKVQKLSKSSGRVWTPELVKHLLKLVAKALAEARKQALLTGPNNPFAQHQAIENARAQMRQMAMTLNPPPEVVESPEFQEMMDMLRPKAAKLNKSDFDRQPMMRGKVRTDVLNQQVNNAVNEADRLAIKKRVAQLQKAGIDRAAVEGATKSLLAMARLLKRRKKKKAGDVSDAESAGSGEAAEVSKSEAEELANLGLELMRTLREEIAPRWSPSQQPWFVNAADNEVYNILLAVVPKELFEETEAFDEMQDLRAGQEVFTLRAADKTAEAVKRK